MTKKSLTFDGYREQLANELLGIVKDVSLKAKARIDAANLLASILDNADKPDRKPIVKHELLKAK